jgi:hypothetical protein
MEVSNKCNLFLRTLNTIFIGVFLFPTFYITLKKVKKKDIRYNILHRNNILFREQRG